jgi:hypothetical protein
MERKFSQKVLSLYIWDALVKDLEYGMHSEAFLGSARETNL